MNLSAVAVENAAFFAVGLSVGLLAGLLIGWAERRAQIMTDPGSSSMSKSTESRSARAMALTAVGILLFGCGMFAGFRALEQKYECLDDYANSLADSLEPRQTDNETLQEREQEAWAAVAAVLAQEDPDAKELKRAVADYLEAAERLDTTRTENPYPPPPREVC